MHYKSHLQVGYAITTLPEGIKPLRQLKRVYDQRREMVESGKGIDWGFAEALAFGTLLSEGEPVLSVHVNALPCMWHMQGCLSRLSCSLCTRDAAHSTGFVQRLLRPAGLPPSTLSTYLSCIVQGTMCG